MSLARGSRAAALLLAVSAVLSPVGPMPASAPALAGGGLLPDLAMSPLRDIRIDWVGGRRLLRFTAMFVNIGQGHFEVRGSRSDTSQPMTMSQVVYETTARDSPIAQQFATSAVASYAGDGHNHWHVNEMTRYDMWGDQGTFRGEKVGLCFLDSDPWNTALPGHVGSYYVYTMCGTSPSALSNRMGVSVGWGDEYEWFLAWQWIDITGVPAGIYTVRAKVDPYGFFLESDEGNQCAWAQVSFDDASTAVTVHQQSGGCVNDIDTSIFAVDIAWAYAAGITVGCAPDLFCTSTAVSREQMASFLVRARQYAPTGTDYFTDDAGSIHQADINSLAAAAVTTGCGSGLYCPTWVVTREQMASFLARALNLPATDADYFTDDAGSPHQADINRLAAAGISTGCGGGRYCPTQPVRRGEMAAFLHRALGD